MFGNVASGSRRIKRGNKWINVATQVEWTTGRRRRVAPEAINLIQYKNMSISLIHLGVEGEEKEEEASAGWRHQRGGAYANRLCEINTEGWNSRLGRRLGSQPKWKASCKSTPLINRLTSRLQSQYWATTKWEGVDSTYWPTSKSTLKSILGYFEVIGSRLHLLANFQVDC